MWPEYPTEALFLKLEAYIASFFLASPDQAVLHLYQNDINPDANSVVGSFTEATFTGYAAIPLTMSAVALNDSNIPVSQSNLCHFQPSGTAVTNTIYGLYITDEPGTTLLVAQRFNTPQVMSSVFNAINGVWRISEPLSNYGWLSVE